jgi:DNA-binding SARP family transcriptional activator
MVALEAAEYTKTTTLEFKFLGSFAVRAGADWHSGPPLKKGREFIQYLGTFPRRVATLDELAASFWPGLDFEIVRHRIHLAASGARVFLRDLLHSDDAVQCVGTGYQWDPEIRIASDVERLIEHTRNASIESQRQAVALYGGDFLAGETADWLQPTRVRIASARACALEAIVEDLIRGEQYASALSYGLELTEADRGHENATRLVMRCYATLGQRTRALETYQHLRAYLAEQIGVEPTSETRELASKLVGRLIA